MSANSFTYFFVIFLMTAVLIWGLRLIAKALESGPAGEPMIKSILAEDRKAPGEELQKGSFSRTAGAFGAMGLAIATIGMAYWLIYALFFAPSNLASIRETWPYFLCGSALFAPYAFKQLSGIFRS